jgi:hypothetical protein
VHHHGMHRWMRAHMHVPPRDLALAHSAERRGGLAGQEGDSRDEGRRLAEEHGGLGGTLLVCLPRYVRWVAKYVVCVRVCV